MSVEIENEGEKMKEIVKKGCVNILEKGHENSTPPKKMGELLTIEGGNMMGNERGMWKDRLSMGRRSVKIGEEMGNEGEQV